MLANLTRGRLQVDQVRMDVVDLAGPAELLERRNGRPARPARAAAGELLQTRCYRHQMMAVDELGGGCLLMENEAERKIAEHGFVRGGFADRKGALVGPQRRHPVAGCKLGVAEGPEALVRARILGGTLFQLLNSGLVSAEAVEEGPIRKPSDSEDDGDDSRASPQEAERDHKGPTPDARIRAAGMLRDPLERLAERATFFLIHCSLLGLSEGKYSQAGWVERGKSTIYTYIHKRNAVP